jgi:EAL domain-containing protein (putative c-di-GMP-specific phosphodiesterase class I)
MNQQLRREACQHLQSWQSEFPSNPPLTMSVNITPKEFAHPDLAKRDWQMPDADRS